MSDDRAASISESSKTVHPLASFLLNDISPPHSPSSTSSFVDLTHSPHLRAWSRRRRHATDTDTEALSFVSSAFADDSDASGVSDFVPPARADLVMPSLQFATRKAREVREAGEAGAAREARESAAAAAVLPVNLLILGRDEAAQRNLAVLMASSGSPDVSTASHAPAAGSPLRPAPPRAPRPAAPWLCPVSTAGSCSFYTVRGGVLPAAELAARIASKLEHVHALLDDAYPASRASADVLAANTAREIHGVLFLFQSPPSAAEVAYARTVSQVVPLYPVLVLPPAGDGRVQRTNALMKAVCHQLTSMGVRWVPAPECGERKDAVFLVPWEVAGSSSPSNKTTERVSGTCNFANGSPMVNHSPATSKARTNTPSTKTSEPPTTKPSLTDNKSHTEGWGSPSDAGETTLYALAAHASGLGVPLAGPGSQRHADRGYPSSIDSIPSLVDSVCASQSDRLAGSFTESLKSDASPYMAYENRSLHSRSGSGYGAEECSSAGTDDDIGAASSKQASPPVSRVAPAHSATTSLQFSTAEFVTDSSLVDSGMTDSPRMSHSPVMAYSSCGSAWTPADSAVFQESLAGVPGAGAHVGPETDGATTTSPLTNNTFSPLRLSSVGTVLDTSNTAYNEASSHPRAASPPHSKNAPTDPALLSLTRSTSLGTHPYDIPRLRSFAVTCDGHRIIRYNHAVAFFDWREVEIAAAAGGALGVYDVTQLSHDAPLALQRTPCSCCSTRMALNSVPLAAASDLEFSKRVADRRRRPAACVRRVHPAPMYLATDVSDTEEEGPVACTLPDISGISLNPLDMPSLVQLFSVNLRALFDEARGSLQDHRWSSDGRHWSALAWLGTTTWVGVAFVTGMACGVTLFSRVFKLTEGVALGPSTSGINWV